MDEKQKATGKEFLSRSKTSEPIDYDKLLEDIYKRFSKSFEHLAKKGD